MNLPRPTVRVLALVLLAFQASVAGAQTIGRFPGMVVNDNNGNPIGPVVYMDPGQMIPVVRIEDSNVNVPAFLKVFSDTQLDGTMGTTYFSSADCVGTAYHNAAFSVNDHGVAALYGYIYSVAISGGAQHLYRTDETATPGGSTSYNSTYAVSGGCTNSSGTISARTAVDVVNLDSMFPPPYSGN